MARGLGLCALLSLLGATGPACTGNIVDETGYGAEEPAGRGGGSGKGGEAGKGAGGGGGSSDSGSGAGAAAGSGGEPAVAGVVPVTRAARLNHAHYGAAVLELFGIADSPSAGFAPDAHNGFAFDTSIELTVDARLGPQYRSAAETLAARAVTDDAVFARIVPCEPAETGCSEEFIATFVRRAFRRPLATTEVDRLEALFARGPELVASGDAFRDGVRLVVEAVLQSPKFLYRVELGDQVDDGGLIPLDDWEVASRLSFFLWGSIPDASLLDAAERGELSSEGAVRSAVLRLLEDAKAGTTTSRFHAQAWQFSRFSRISPDPGEYPGLPADLVTRVEQAANAFVAAVVESGGGLEELLTAPYAFADSETASLYGQSLPGGLERIEFESGERLGILMQVGFLASHAYAIKTDPIHRGLFVLRDILCRTIPDPPPGATETPPPETTEPIETTRDEISLLTGQPDCTGCHLAINAPGFAFEGFDAVGRSRSEENGVAVDTTGELELDGAPVSFGDARELVVALAASEEARRCYASKWLSFAYGRRLAADDDPTLAAIAAEPASVAELATAVATTRAFLKRARNEVAP